MITDPVGDLFTRIRNAALAKKREVNLPYSNLKFAVAQVLLKEGYLLEVKKVRNDLVLALAFKHREPVITGVKNVSRPGVRIYRGKKDLPRTLGGEGISVISTPKGVMSNKDAKKKNLGGEVLGEVW